MLLRQLARPSEQAAVDTEGFRLATLSFADKKCRIFMPV